MSIFNNILNLFPMNSDVSLLNIDGFHDHIIVYLKEFTDATSVYFKVDLNCVNNLCMCKHTIAGIPAQLLPCRVFSECFFYEERSIMTGALF